MASLMPFFGVAAPGAAPEVVQKGRRRTVTYLSVLNLILLGVSAGYQEWVYGGVEFDPLSSLPPSFSSLDEATLTPAARAALGAPKLGASVQRWFTLGLSRSYFEGNFNFRYSNESSYQITEFESGAYIRNINVGTTLPNTRWYGTPPISTNVLAPTLGLLGFTAFLQAVMWLVMALIQYELPGLIEWKHTPLTVRVLSLSTAFFTFVGVLVFTTSNVKSSFCTGFDPDNGTTGDGIACVYGASAGCAISALVFQIITAAIVWVGLSADLGATYSFKAGGFEAAGGGGAGAGAGAGASFSGSFQTGGAGGYNGDVSGGDGNDVPFKASGYQDA